MRYRAHAPNTVCIQRSWMWSGDTLMDLDRYQALKMETRTIGDAEFLFIEAGGFSERNKSDWKSKWYVLGRK